MTSLQSQACERCWKRKQKCSREIPTCQQCVAASSQCIHRRFGSVVDASDPSAISYIESLKSRIRNLEAQRNEGFDSASTIPSSDGSPIHRRSSSLATNDALPRRDSEVIDQAQADQRPKGGLQDAMHEANYLSLSAMAEPTDRQPFSTQGISFLTLLLAATSVGGSNPSLPIGVNESLSGPMADFRSRVFSQRSGLEGPQTAAAFKTFLEKSLVAFPLMARSELEGLYHTVTQMDQGGYPENMINDSPEKIVIVSISTAIGLLLSPNYSYTEVLASELAMKALQLMSRVFDYAGDLAAVRCLALFTIYSLYTPYGGSSWHILGLAMTRCISSGLHTSRVSDSDSDNETKRQNSRAFWTLYALDTHLSTMLDRPFCLNDSDITISPPSSPRDTVLDVDTAVLRHLILHGQILRSIRKQTKEDLVCHFVNLCHWKETVPTTMSKSDLLADHLFARGLVELLKCSAFANDAGRDMVLKHAEEECAKYVTSTEGRLVSQQQSPDVLEGHLVFAIGVVIASQPRNEERQKRVFQCVSSLTMLSTRYSAIRHLRDILAALQFQPESTEHVGNLVEQSEIAVSRQLQRLIFGGLQAGNINENIA